jgi:hypothetical protein
MNKKKGIFPFLAVFALVAGILACDTSTVTNLFASPTPTSTDIPTPTPTFTPTPTPTATATPTMTPTPLPTGVSTEKQADGSTLLTDYDNKFKLSIPANWVVIPFDKENLSLAIDQASKENPELTDELSSLKGINTDIYRVFAIYANRNYLLNGNPPTMTISILTDPSVESLPLAFLSGQFEEGLKGAGGKILTQGVNEINNPNGTEVEYIDLRQNITSQGVIYTIDSRILLFKIKDKLVAVQLMTPKQFRNDILPIANDIGATIELLK